MTQIFPGENEGMSFEIDTTQRSINLDSVDFQLGTDRHTTQVYDAIAPEIYNDADHAIEQLTEEERARLRFVAVPTTHTEQFAQDVAEIFVRHQADYVLLETVGMTEAQRLALDLLDNLLIRQATVQPTDMNIAMLEMATVAAARDWRGIIIRQCTGQRPLQPPVFRLIDMAEDSPGFGADHMSRDVIAVATNFLDLYGTPHGTLQEAAREKLIHADDVIRDREAEQLADISRIAAKAVRLHPDKDEIVVGVSFGSAHSMVARNLERKGVDVTIHPTGPNAELPHDALSEGGSSISFDIGTALLRKATHAPEQINEQDISCLIAYRLIANALDTYLQLPGRTRIDGRVSHVLETISSALVYELDAQQHKELLSIAESNRMSKAVPFFRQFRLATAVVRTNRAVVGYLQETLGDLDQFAEKVIDELKTR
jgi:hypothetical protein